MVGRNWRRLPKTTSYGRRLCSYTAQSQLQLMKVIHSYGRRLCSYTAVTVTVDEGNRHG